MDKLIHTAAGVLKVDDPLTPGNRASYHGDTGRSFGSGVILEEYNHNPPGTGYVYIKFDKGEYAGMTYRCAKRKVRPA